MSSDGTKKAPFHASPAEIGIIPYTPPKNRNGRTSTVKARKEYQLKSIPSNVMTCIQVKALLKKSNCSSKGITICSQCGQFELDRHSIKRLRQIEDNNPRTVGVSIPKHFQCQTWWVTESKNTTAFLSSTSPPSPSSSSLPMEPSHTPPILSKGHSTRKSPLQEDDRRTTADYSIGRWSSTASNPPKQAGDNDSPKKKKRRKGKARNNKKKNLTPESVPSSSPAVTTNHLLKNLKRSKLEQICELAVDERKYILAQLKQMESLNEELTQTCKRHLEQISSLTTEVNYQTAKRQRTDDTLKNFAADSKKLSGTLEHVRKSVTVSQQHIASLLMQNEALAKEAREVHRVAVREGVEQATSDLPKEIDAAGLSFVINDAFERVHKGKTQVKRAEVAADAVWNLYGGQCRPKLLDYCEENLRQQNPYRRAQEIAKVMDLSPGQLNLSGYKALREGLEDKNNKGKIPRGKGWLCSDYYVKQAMQSIENQAKNVVPYQMLYGVDGFQFDYEKALVYLTDSVFDLREAAMDRTQPRILWAFTVDGVSVSRNISLLIAGVKCLDPRAIDPKMGEHITLVQSPDMCFPFKVIVCPDNKSTYQEYLVDFFAYFKDLKEKQVGPYPPGTFDSVSPQDGSSLWKALDRGGACKVKKEFCPYCACTSDRCVLPRSNPCERCVSIGRKRCFHWDVGDADTYARHQASLESLQASFPFLAGNNREVSAHLSMRFSPDDVVKDCTNIEFELDNNDPDSLHRFSRNVNKDLKDLKLSRLGSLQQRQTRLLAALKACHRYSDCVAGQEATRYPGAMIMVRQAVPCVLHLENRCGEKFVKTLLIERIQQSNKTDQQQKELIRSVEHVVNTQVLGHPWRPSNWKIPLAKDDKSKMVVSDLTMPNQHVRKFLMHLHRVTAVLFDATDDNERKRKEAWDECRDLWGEVTEMARMKEDFSDEDISEFQDRCDDFISAWLDLCGGNVGMTNYFHIVAAGHLTYYLKVYRNLYRFSQQGWEGMNSVVKSLLHKRTQRGGHGGKRGQKNSKVEPIARWALRRMFFLSGDYKTKVTYKNL
jgi:hypothetical protein